MDFHMCLKVLHLKCVFTQFSKHAKGWNDGMGETTLINVNFVQDFGQKTSFIVLFLCHFHKSGDGLEVTRIWIEPFRFNIVNQATC
jgi:hypothetical protein